MQPASLQPARMVLGIDIGGTSIKWGLAEVNPDGSVGDMVAINAGNDAEKRFTRSKPTHLKDQPETQSLAFIAKTYQEILNEAQDIATKEGAILAGVGIGSPGRFIAPTEYEEHYCGPNRTTPHEKLGREADKLKKEFGRDPYNKTVSVGGDARVVAPGSNPNMAKKQDDTGQAYSQLDGVALPAFLQAMTPVRLRMENDAAVQMRAIVEGLKGEEAEILNGKKAIYLGFGTGVGAALMNEEGNMVTDGHFQHTKLPKRAGDEEVYEKISAFAKEEGKLPDGATPSAEMMFAASNINRLLQLPFQSESLSAPSLADCEKRMLECAEGDDAAKTSRRYMESVGRYMADYLANLQQGQFEHCDPKAKWSAADHEAIKNFQAITFGGALAASKAFGQVIAGATKSELAKKGIALLEANEKAPEGAENIIHYVRATDQTTEHTIKASMGLLDRESLLLSSEAMAMARSQRAAANAR
jgi:predicted NBD/HSP70 family sugar kinase